MAGANYYLDRELNGLEEKKDLGFRILYCPSPHLYSLIKFEIQFINLTIFKTKYFIQLPQSFRALLLTPIYEFLTNETI